MLPDFRKKRMRAFCSTGYAESQLQRVFLVVFNKHCVIQYHRIKHAITRGIREIYSSRTLLTIHFAQDGITAGNNIPRRKSFVFSRLLRSSRIAIKPRHNFLREFARAATRTRPIRFSPLAAGVLKGKHSNIYNYRAASWIKGSS